MDSLFPRDWELRSVGIRCTLTACTFLRQYRYDCWPRPLADTKPRYRQTYRHRNTGTSIDIRWLRPNTGAWFTPRDS